MHTIQNSLLRRRSSASKRGNLLLVSIMFVMIVASMGMVMLQMHTSQARRQIQATDNKRALYIAEAGLAEAFMCVAQGKSGNVGSETLPARFADGIYWVEATHGANDEIGLVSTGLCGSGRFALSLVLTKQSETISSLGFYAEQDVVVGAGSIVDGYDSRAGSLLEQLDPSLAFSSTGTGAVIGAGGDVVLQASLDPSALQTHVFGDVHAGPSGVVSQESGTTITGATTPLPFSAGLPDASAPQIDTTTAWPFGIGSGALAAGTYRFTQAEVSSRQTLRIEGPAVLVFDELRIKRGATLEIDSTEGQVVIFVEDYLELAEGSATRNVNEDPQGFALVANGDQWEDRDGDLLPDPPVVFSPAGNFHGYLYTPSAELTLGPKLHFVGGLAALSLTLLDGARLTFDIALGGGSLSGSGMPRLVAWRIVELPDSDLVRLREEPIRKLAEQGITPVDSAVASADRWVRMKYFDQSGNPQAYSGMQSGLDWTQVYKIIGIMWDDDPVVGDEGQIWEVPASLSKLDCDSQTR